MKGKLFFREGIPPLGMTNGFHVDQLELFFMVPYLKTKAHLLFLLSWMTMELGISPPCPSTCLKIYSISFYLPLEGSHQLHGMFYLGTVVQDPSLISNLSTALFTLPIKIPAISLGFGSSTAT